MAFVIFNSIHEQDAVEACLRLLVGAAGAPAPTEASSDGGKEAGEGGEGGGVRAEGEPTTPRTVVVGDSLHHDVLGARNAGLPSLLITAYGVHAEEIPAVSATLRPQQHNSETVTTLEGNESVPDNKAGPTYDTFLAASLTTSKIEGEENKTVDQIIAQQKQASKSTLVVPVADKAHETFEKHSIIPNYVACAFRWNCSS
uniref:Uncharacterized protein n=1 Tax=Heterosigma akashiwo TaxID=2829 RepID=A0A7S3Y0J3_HETAK|mmetsp:Transcript_10291/g.16206  ORF Transcript_10291/g.16206 Transcript_10291/m.16206 type:complete len:200 (+) Transcript_10291:39-638(+)